MEGTFLYTNAPSDFVVAFSNLCQNISSLFKFIYMLILLWPNFNSQLGLILSLKNIKYVFLLFMFTPFHLISSAFNEIPVCIFFHYSANYLMQLINSYLMSRITHILRHAQWSICQHRLFNTYFIFIKSAKVYCQ